MLSKIKAAIPWWGKIGIKLALARIPVPYRVFAKRGVFRHGFMDSADYALGVFRTHYRHAPNGPWVGLEFGPGDSVFSAPLAKRHGCQRLWLVDAGDFADRNPALYQEMAASLEQTQAIDGLLPLCSGGGFDALLLDCGATYLTSGLASLAAIETESVDFIWSHAVLEHVRAMDFEPLCREMHRILRPGGRASHVVDFKDHLEGDLNNLRIPSSLWERDWFAQASGFYTNRLRCAAMQSFFAEAGFNVEILSSRRWNKSPIERHQLALEFQGLHEDDLLVSDSHFLLRKGSHN